MIILSSLLGVVRRWRGEKLVNQTFVERSLASAFALACERFAFSSERRLDVLPNWLRSLRSRWLGRLRCASGVQSRKQEPPKVCLGDTPSRAFASSFGDVDGAELACMYQAKNLLVIDGERLGSQLHRVVFSVHCHGFFRVVRVSNQLRKMLERTIS